MKTLSLAMLFILASCVPSFEKTTLNFDDGAISTTPLVAEGEPVTFEVLKAKLLVPQCLSCHKNVGDEEKVSNWISPGKIEESELYNVIKDGSMPKNAAPLDSRYLDLVARYIESAKIPETPTPPVVAGSFEEIKQKILVPHCLKCHEDVDNEKTLMEWITPNKPELSPFYLEIKSGEMPQEEQALSAEEAALVEKYISSMKPVPVEVEPEIITFEYLQEKIIVPSCIKCHAKMGEEDKIQKWIVPGNAAASKFYQVLENGSMPKKASPLTENQLSLVKKYIDSVKPIKMEEPVASFEEIKKSILEPKCLGCHKKMGDEAILISKWVTPGDLENSKMYKSVVNGSMPKKADRLSEAEIAAIASYIKSVKAP